MFESWPHFAHRTWERSQPPNICPTGVVAAWAAGTDSTGRPPSVARCILSTSSRSSSCESSWRPGTKRREMVRMWRSRSRGTMGSRDVEPGERGIWK